MAKNKSKFPAQIGGGCLSLFGLPFLAGGLVVSWIYFAGFADWWRAQAWVEVPCWIESADLKVNTGDDSKTYLAVATYRYEFAGREYRGDRVSLRKMSDNIGNFQHDAHREISGYVIPETATRPEADARQPAAKPFRCYVNPAKPDEAVLYRVLRWQMQAFMAIFALTFPAVGAGLVAGGFIGARLLKREEALKAGHPSEPWRWKSDWAGPAIPESSGIWAKALHLYTLWSGLVVIPLGVATAWSGALLAEPLACLVLVFFGLWLIPLKYSMRRLRQWLTVGPVSFEPAESPFWPGGTLAGAIVTKRPLPMRGDAEVSLVCERKTTRDTGDSSSTTTERIWTHEEHVTMDRVTRDLAGFRLPVSFALPPDAPESDGTEAPSVKHLWKLQLKVPGTSISPAFEVPVFRTGKSPAAIPGSPGAAMSVAGQVAADMPALLAARKIRAEFDSRGFPLSIHCPPARQRGMIGFLLLFNLVWTGVAVLLIYQDAPLVFRIVWPVSASALWIIILYQLLHSRTVTFHPTGLDAVDRVGPWSRAASFAKTGITGFVHDSNMTSGSTVFYRVRLVDVFDRKTTLVDGISEEAAAEALAKRLDEWRTST